MDSWQGIKEAVYFEDGSLRDIYINHTDQTDWLKWIDFVNETYWVSFYNGPASRYEERIDSDIIIQYWQGKHDLVCNATVILGNVLVMTYFFSPDEIENDVNPSDIKTLNDHNTLISYLNRMGEVIQKPVYFTEQNSKDRLIWDIIKK